MCSMKLLLTLQKQLQSKTCAAIIEWPSFAVAAFGKSFNDCNYTFLLPKQKQLKLYEMPSLQQLHSNSMNDSLARHTSMEKINLDRNNLTEAFNGTELLQKHSINSIIEQRQDFLNQSYNNNDANNMDDIVLHNSNADRNNETFVNTITSIMHSGMFNDFLNLTETVQNPCNNAKGNLYNANLRLRNNILMSGSNDDINVGGPIATSNNAINNIDDLKNAMDNFQSNGTNNLTTVMSSNYMPLTPNSTQSSISPIISSSNTATINTFDIFPFGNIAPSLSSSSPQHQQQQLQLHEQEVQYKQLQSQTNLNHHHRQSLTETSQQIQKEQRQQRHHHLQQLSQQQSQQQSQHQQHLILTPPSSTIVTTTKTKTIAQQQQQQQQQLPLKVFHRNINSFDCSALLSPTTPTTTLYNNSFQSCSPLVRESSNSSLANSGGLSLDPLSLTYQNICCNNNKTNNNNSNNMSNTNNNNNVNNNSSIQSTRSTTPESQNSHQSNENNVINITHQKQKQLQQYKQKQQYLEQQLQQQQQQQLPIQIPPQSAPQIQSLLHNSINQLNESLLSACNSNENASMDTYLDRIAKFHRGSAAFREATCTWSGQLPPSSHRLHQFSPKVFLGGIPWDISEESLIQIFKPFGQIKVEWPGKEHLAAQPKGYVYVIFESDKQVKSLLSACVVQMDVQHNSAGIFYFKISSRRIKAKDVEVIPWWIGDSNYVKSTSQKLDPTKTVFVGALHGKLTAEGLAKVMDDLFDGVVYAGIDTDKYKYPIGSGRVTFNNNRSYMKAVSAAFIEIRTTKFTKKVQIDPYLEDSLCSMCGVQHGPYYCRELSCFRYFCRTCWQWQHSTDDVKFHKPLTRNAKTQTLIGLGPAMSALSFALNSPNSITYGNTMQQQHQQQLSTSSSQLIRKQLNAARSLNSLETIVPMQQQQYLLNQTQQQQQQQRQQEALCAAITSTAQKLQNLQNQLRL